MIPTEHAEQVGFLQWFKLQFPHVLIFAIPNGEKRAISVAKRLKAEGVTPGVPDLFVPEFNFWIEMKRRKGGRLSERQKRIFAELERAGHAVIVGMGAEDASKKVLDFIKKASVI